MSGSSSKPKSQTVTNSSEPWGPQIPLLTQSFEDAKKLYDQGGLNLQYFPGQTVASAAPETAQSWNQITNLANQGSKGVGAANDYITSILNGQSTPGMDQAIARARNAVNANYSRAGRYGSGAHDDAVAGAISNAIFNQMSQAAQMAPGLAQARYIDPQMLAGVGAQRQGQAQNEINSAIDRFNFQQNAPANAIGLYQQLGGGNYGGTSYGTSPVQNQSSGNPWLQGAGIAAQLGGTLLGGLF